MPLIGARELSEQATQVLRRVREEGAEYVITYREAPIALLLPVDSKAVEQVMAGAVPEAAGGGWAVYAQVAERIRRAWPREHATQEVLDEVRHGERRG